MLFNAFIKSGSADKDAAVAAAELAGQTVLGDGLATKVRPRKYFVIPKDSLERFTGDAEQLINFFVIEFQRILFAENIWATILVRKPFP